MRRIRFATLISLMIVIPVSIMLIDRFVYPLLGDSHFIFDSFLTVLPVVGVLIILKFREKAQKYAHLKENEVHFRSAFDHAAIGMALISLQGRYIKVNQAMCDILGYSEDELLTLTQSGLVHAGDLDTYEEQFNELVQGQIKNFQLVLRFYHKNGDIVWITENTSLMTNANGTEKYCIAQLQNITVEKNAEEKLRHLAYHDALTGLFNRNKLEQQMLEIVLNARRHNTGFAVVFMDLDRFKYINDTIGHDTGDALLQIIAERIRNNLRGTDVIARIGGDEFVIVLTNVNQVDLIAGVLQKIVANIMQPIMIKGSELSVTASFGVSVYPYDGTDIQSLMKNADLALYRAKEMGRNNYQFCTQEMTAKAQLKMSRQTALMQALAKNEFEIYYQPKWNFSENRVSGVEALLRWNNNEFKNITTYDVVQLAEDSGLIFSLNEWVLKTACEQTKKWHDAGFEWLTVSVNLSPRQFKQLVFVDNLLKMLSEMEFPASHLELELTESIIMQDPDYVLRRIEELKEHKIQIAIDDFGTGYSSLDYLRRFAIDKIKIDRTFIHRIGIDATSGSVVTAIMAMANKLGIKTIAEGVETREQCDFLIQEKCTEIQGYYLCPPGKAATIETFLQHPSMIGAESHK